MDGTGEFERLVDERSSSLLRTAYLLAGDWALAEDLLQTALYKTWRSWDNLREPRAAEAYTRQVMVRVHAAWWRRRWRGETPTAELPEAPADAGDSYGRVDTRDALRAALAQLTPRQRAAVVLRFYEDLSEADVAVALGCSVGTVKSTCSRALAQLRRSGLLDDARPAAACALPAAEPEGALG